MKRQKPTPPVAAEVLEARVLLSAIAGQALSVQGTRAADVIDLGEGDDGSLVVTVNGRTQTYAPGMFTAVSVQAGNGADRVTSAVGVPVVLDGGNGDDALLVVISPADNVLIGGNGSDLVSSTGSGRDVLLGGNGRDTLYGIVGAANVVLGGRGGDRLIVRQGVETHDGGRQDTLVAFRFDGPRVEFRGGVVYLMGGDGDDRFTVRQDGRRLLVSDGDTRYVFRGVEQVAGLGFGGDDVYDARGTSVGLVVYGTAGRDVLLGGSGDDVLKGGGDDDVVIGGRGRDFLTGDSGRDVVLGQGTLLLDEDDPFGDPGFWLD